MSAKHRFPTLLNEADAAKQLGISPRTLRSMRNRGMIRYVKPSPGLVRYRLDDLAAHLERHTTLEEPCRSTNRAARPSTSTTSSTKVVAFTDLLAAKRNAMQKE